MTYYGGCTRCGTALTAEEAATIERQCADCQHKTRTRITLTLAEFEDLWRFMALSGMYLSQVTWNRDDPSDGPWQAYLNACGPRWLSGQPLLQIYLRDWCRQADRE